VYITEILERCADLAAHTARVYRALADRFQGDPERVQLWRELAFAEETHADVLRREFASFQDQEQSGAYLPEYVERLQRMDAQLEVLETQARAARTLDDALAVAVALEQADLEDLYDDLILQGEPAFKLISERIEAALVGRPQPTLAAGTVRRARRQPG